MGLLSRLGKSAANIGHAAYEGGMDTVSGAALGVPVGMGLGGSGGEFMTPQTAQAGVVGGALGGAAGGVLGLRRIVMAIAQELKRKHPQAPDEMILQQAMKMAQQQAGPPAGGMPPGPGGM